jgi:hypothetical protein
VHLKTGEDKKRIERSGFGERCYLKKREFEPAGKGFFYMYFIMNG